jgi:DNA-binding transcriptional regulator LsrR (DeoR family)
LSDRLPSAAVADRRATARARWPVDDRVRARVARRYFIDQATKVEIGAEFGLTRFQVAKLVQDCLDDGTVVITVHGPEHVDDALSDRLGARFGLVDALVADDLAGASRYAVAMLASRLDDGDVLAVDGSPVVDAVLSAASGLPACQVVQARGVAGLDDHGIEVVKRVAQACGGEAYPIYAPFLSRHPADAVTLRSHPLVEVAIGRFERVAAAVLGVEDPRAAGGPWAGVDAGAVAALGPVLVGADGAPLPSTVEERAIGLSADQVRRVPFVLLADSGQEKAPQMDAVLRGGMVHAVVTDVPTAVALLDARRPQGS